MASPRVYILGVRADQPVIGVDPIGGNAELFEGGFLSGEVLFVGGAASVADEGGRHGEKCNVKPPLNGRIVVLAAIIRQPAAAPC